MELRLADLARDLAWARQQSEQMAAELREEVARRAALELVLSAAVARVEDTRTWAGSLRSEIRSLADMLRAEQTWRRTLLAELRQFRSGTTELERPVAAGSAPARLDEQDAAVSGPLSSRQPSIGAARAEAGGSEAEDDRSELDRLAARLRSPELREQLELWRAARCESGLPRFDAIWATALDRPHPRAVLAEVGADGRLGSLRSKAGPDPLPLEHALRVGSPEQVAGPLATGWLRCIRTSRPVHEFAHVVLGTTHHRYERLVLPFSADGSRLDRLLGLSVAERDV